MKKILSFIGARGGSTGLPGKNVRLLGGKPLISWTIEASLASRLINKTVVSSDSDKILDIARKNGARTIKRPKKLATNIIGLEPSIEHVLKYLKKTEGYVPDIIVCLQPTSPMRTGNDIDRALELLIKNPKAEAVLSVHELDSRFLKSFILNHRGFLTSYTIKDYPFWRRQDLPVSYVTNGAIYAITRKAFENTSLLFSDRALPYVMSLEKSMDVDTLDDFKKIESVLNQRKK